MSKSVWVLAMSMGLLVGGMPIERRRFRNHEAACAGTATGAVVGGLVGSTIGSGRGSTLATAAEDRCRIGRRQPAILLTRRENAMRIVRECLAVAVSAGLGIGAAMAQGSGGMTKSQLNFLDKNGNDAVTMQEYSDYLSNAFSYMDGDASGSLSRAEVGSLVSDNQFSQMDANGNGRISRQEFIGQGAGTSRRPTATDRATSNRYPATAARRGARDSGHPCPRICVAGACRRAFNGLHRRGRAVAVWGAAPEW